MRIKKMSVRRAPTRAAAPRSRLEEVLALGPAAVGAPLTRSTPKRTFSGWISVRFAFREPTLAGEKSYVHITVENTGEAQDRMRVLNALSAAFSEDVLGSPLEGWSTSNAGAVLSPQKSMDVDSQKALDIMKTVCARAKMTYAPVELSEDPSNVTVKVTVKFTYSDLVESA